MLLTCPHCMTIFRVNADLILPNGQTVRCSMCYHVWIASPVLPSANQPNVQSTNGVFAESPVRSVSPLSVARNRLKSFRKPFLAAVLAATLASAVIMNRGIITAYLPFLINGFDRIGLSIRPTLAQLQVTGLDASYFGDTMRVSGRLRNIGMWRTHSADLRVSVRGENGIVMQEMVIRPDDDVINRKAESRFFVQLAVEASPEAHVTVTPLANRVHR